MCKQIAVIHVSQKCSYPFGQYFPHLLTSSEHILCHSSQHFMDKTESRSPQQSILLQMSLILNIKVTFVQCLNSILFLKLKKADTKQYRP